MSNSQKDSFYGYRFNKFGHNLQKQSLEEFKKQFYPEDWPNIYKNRICERTDFVLFYCPNCGNNIYGDWKYYNDKWKNYGNDCGKNINKTIYQEIDLFKKSAICPCCNNLLRYSEGYYHEYGFDFIYDTTEYIREYYPKMEKKRKELYIKQSKTDVEDFIKQIDENYIISTYPNVVKIKESPETLNTYLQNILQIEANIISLSERLEILYFTRSENNEFISSEKSTLQYEINQKLKEAENRYQASIKAYDNVPNEIVMEKVDSSNYFSLFTPPAPPTKPIEPVLQKPGLFNKKKVMEQNNVLIQQYNNAIKEYEHALEKHQFQVEECNRKRNEAIKAKENAAKDKYNQAIAYALAKAKENVDDAKAYLEEIQIEKNRQNKEIENLFTPGVQIGTLISDEIKTAETMLKELVACRKTLYGCNAIFSKYQNIVAVSTFSEYLAAGRCETLEGSAGAYNLYESEIRSNTIISSLSQIEESLEEIKNTQYMIYSKLDSIDRTLCSLANSMSDAVSALKSMDNKLSRIEENSEVIAYNTQATAYYSKMNAELTNSLGYLVALN